MLSPPRHFIGHSTERRSSISSMPRKQASTSRFCGSSICSASLPPLHFEFGEAGGSFAAAEFQVMIAPARIGRDDEVAGALDDAGEMQLHPAHFLAEAEAGPSRRP